MTGRDESPRWCRKDHSATAVPDDEHVGALTEVPAVQEVITGAPSCAGRRAVAVTFDVLRHQAISESDEWVTIGADTIGDVHLSVESARRLAVALLDVTETPQDITP